MNDIGVMIVNLTFALITTHQVYKIYRFKEARSHSYIWHIITCVGLLYLTYLYFEDCLYFSVLSCLFTFSTRLTIILQIYYYNNHYRFNINNTWS